MVSSVCGAAMADVAKDALIQPHQLKTVDDFTNVMIKIRNIRRTVVDAILMDKPLVNGTHESLKNAQDALEQNINGFVRNFRPSELEDNPLLFNVKDELLGVKKDITFLRSYTDKTLGDWNNFIDYLAQYHPADKKLFMEEVRNVEEMLERLIVDGIKILLTDWDGTMKAYGSNYVTCMQPAYSAVVLSKFAKKYTKFAAVLTAGPLQDHGILDLTAVPAEGGWLHFGGSWGREWLLTGKRVVDESCFTDKSREALSSLICEIEKLLKCGEYKHFRFIGSGFQRKVDRLTLGFQNVSNDIEQTTSNNYLAKVRDCRLRVDPAENMFVQVNHEMDTEIILKQTVGLPWDKAMGCQFIVNHLHIDPAQGNVLVMGDTMSDVPMAKWAAKVNHKTHVIFVNSAKNVKDALTALLPNDRLCFVSSPDVIHAAMAKLVLK